MHWVQPAKPIGNIINLHLQKKGKPSEKKYVPHMETTPQMQVTSLM